MVRMWQEDTEAVRGALWPYGDNLSMRRIAVTGFHPSGKEGTRELALVEVNK